MKKEVTLAELQKRAFANKVKQGFNTTKIEPELLYLTEELGEAVGAYRRDKQEEFAEEVVDILIYCLGLLTILKKDAAAEVLKKMEKNEGRVYTKTSEKGWGHTDLDKK